MTRLTVNQSPWIDERGVELGPYMTAVDVSWPGKKTATFNIVDRHGGLLGTVKWCGAWRQYCFFPEGESSPVFNNDCLNRISAFMALCTKTHRDQRTDGHKP